MTRIAPTIASWLGLSLDPDADEPLPISVTVTPAAADEGADR